MLTLETGGFQRIAYCRRVLARDTHEEERVQAVAAEIVAQDIEEHERPRVGIEGGEGGVEFLRSVEGGADRIASDRLADQLGKRHVADVDIGSRETSCGLARKRQPLSLTSLE